MADDRPTAATVVTRMAAAVLGGYACAYWMAGAAATVLPASPNDAASFAGLLGLCAYVAVIVWAFAARSLRRLLGGMAALLAIAIAIVRLSEMWR